MAQRGGVRGLLSIVVPVYNVEHYLGPLLVSVQRQTYRDIEIIVVDDGSTDGSLSVARRFRRRDPRIRIISQANAGLGAARNAGAVIAKGEYLAFIDSDDTVDRHAFRYTIATLEVTGSDLAIAPYRRLVREQERPAGPWIHLAHEHERLAVDIDDAPDILVNAVAWSKVYRRAFWEDNAFRFPEGVLYEDQVVSARAYALASRFDIVTHPSVNWRVREDRSSISQVPLSLRNTRDHLVAARGSLDELGSNGHERARRARLAQLLTNDYAHNIPMLPDVGAEEWATFRDALTWLVEEADASPDVWDDVPMRNKVAYALVIDDRRTELRAFLVADGWRTDRFATTIAGADISADLEALAETLAGVPASAFHLSTFETRLRSETRQVRWIDATTLEITGHAIINHVDPATHEIGITAALTSAATGRRVAATHAGFERDPLASTAFSSANVDGGRAFFRVLIDIAELADAEGDFAVELTLNVGEVERRRHLHDHRRGAVVDARLHDGVLTDVISDAVGYLVVRRTRPADVAERTQVTGRRVDIHLAATSDLEEIALVRADDRFDTAVSIAAVSRRAGEHRGGHATVTIPEAIFPAADSHRERVWRIVGRCRGGEWKSIIAGGDIPLRGNGGPGTVTLERRVAGRQRRSRTAPADPRRSYFPGSGLLVVQRERAAVISDMEMTEDRLVGRLSLRTRPGDSIRVELSSRRMTLDVPASIVDDGTLEFDVPLSAARWGGPVLSLPRGDYHLLVHVAGQTIRPLAAGSLLRALPIARSDGTARVWIGSDADGHPTISLDAPLRADERGPYRQRRLQAMARAGVLRERPAQPFVFFRSLYGEATGDSAEAIHHELRRRGSGLGLVWSTSDASVPVPEGGRRVIEGSEEFYRTMTSASYVVVNVHQPDWFIKSPGQVLIQTMHGYPFKLAGSRHWAASALPPSRVDSFLFRAGQWDYFVSPAAYATPLLREFLPTEGWAGEMLELGYPRNDVLLSAEAHALRERTRTSLGIAPERKVVLYAPTYRDYLAIDEFRARALTSLDLRRLARTLGSGYAILVRAHMMNARAGFSSRGAEILDVTDHPSINALMLASDAAVVDYSSLRFDYALTGKPMIFFVPDRERYFAGRESMADYDATSPGPHLTTTGQVIDALRDLPAARSRYADAVRRFRTEFMELEDGRAAERLVDRVFAPRGDA